MGDEKTAAWGLAFPYYNTLVCIYVKRTWGVCVLPPAFGRDDDPYGKTEKEEMKQVTKWWWVVGCYG